MEIYEEEVLDDRAAEEKVLTPRDNVTLRENVILLFLFIAIKTKA